MSTVFVVNAGSSSLKYQLVELASGASLASGLIERIGQVRSSAKHKNAAGGEAQEELHIQDHAQAFGWVLRQFDAVGPSLDDADMIGVGHRVVQGGSRFDRATIIDGRVQDQIEALSPLAPLHNPANVVGIRAARAAFANLPHVAVFDTALPPHVAARCIHVRSGSLGCRRAPSAQIRLPRHEPPVCVAQARGACR